MVSVYCLISKSSRERLGFTIIKPGILISVVRIKSPNNGFRNRIIPPIPKIKRIRNNNNIAYPLGGVDVFSFVIIFN